MKKVLTTLLLTLLAGTLFAGETKVAVVISKTSYRIAESETGSAGKAWTAVANLAGLPYETLFVEDLKEEALDTYSLLVLSQCLYLTDAEYALVDKAVRHFVEAGKGVVVDGPAGLYDHEEEFRKDRTLDTYLGMRYQYDVPMDGFRLRVADNDHFITTKVGLFSFVRIPLIRYNYSLRIRHSGKDFLYLLLEFSHKSLHTGSYHEFLIIQQSDRIQFHLGRAFEGARRRKGL